MNNFAPKATVKTKGKISLILKNIYSHRCLALPRLYERLCEEKTGHEDGDEADSSQRQG